MHISQLADRTGVPASTLRYYESVGLLPADRDSAGYRVYDHSAVERLAFITAAKHFGLSLTQIRDLTQISTTDTTAETAKPLRNRLAAYLDEAEHRFNELDTFMATLRTTIAQLESKHHTDETLTTYRP